jgi:tetratricopeptide (TPR) repeat protein
MKLGIMVRLALIISVFLSFLAPFNAKIYAEDSNLSKAQQLFRKGEALYNENRLENALRYYFDAINLFPSMPKAYYRMGVIYGPLRRQYKKGIEFFHKSIKHDSQDPNAYHGLGMTYCMSGNERLGSKFLLKAAMMFLKEGNITAALCIYDVLRQTGEKDSTQKLARAIENHRAGGFLYPFRGNGNMGDSPVRSRDSGG